MNTIKAIAATLIIFYTATPASAQFKVPSILKQIPSSNSGQPSADEIGAGIKDALQTGIANGTSRLSAPNGFLNNPSVKIAFPTEALKLEKTLRSMGFNELCDNVVNSLNHAAEDAVKEALPVFRESLKQMSIKDASNILLATEKDAATQYFKTSTSAQLTEKFKPIIQASLDKAGATKYWAAATSQYNKVPLTSKINTDLNDYVTKKALAGLFQEIAKEELKIRESSGARATPLLQKVFAYADQKK